MNYIIDYKYAGLLYDRDYTSTFTMNYIWTTMTFTLGLLPQKFWKMKQADFEAL